MKRATDEECKDPHRSSPEKWSCKCHEAIVAACPPPLSRHARLAVALGMPLHRNRNKFDTNCYRSKLCGKANVCSSWKKKACTGTHMHAKPTAKPIARPTAKPIAEATAKPTGECIDDDKGVKAASHGRASTCAAVAGHCRDPKIGALVREHCPKACGICGFRPADIEVDLDDAISGKVVSRHQWAPKTPTPTSTPLSASGRTSAADSCSI